MKLSDAEIETIYHLLGKVDLVKQPQYQQIERNLIQEKFRKKMEKRYEKRLAGTVIATGKPPSPD